MPGDPTSDLQPQALEALTALFALKSDWAGSLVLSIGLNAQGRAFAIASNIAGAVSLSIDNSPDDIREVVRTGAVDFVVNTLDEAIRAMKNEVRKRAPLSVALAASPSRALAEIVSRGLAPALVTIFTSTQELEPVVATSSEAFKELGATLIDFTATSHVPGYRLAGELIASITRPNGWELSTLTFNSSAEQRAFDTRAAAMLAPGDHLRRRWLDAVPRILQRQRPSQRSLWLTPAEAEQLLSAEKRS
ncbi:hypothetical protein [Edaphobacter flagellatus]|uniref:hypothetical protein n=1 Tax=Edaphobacter flagellatus TaxID=1933044 RepID=UPI0021B321C2|nr:hypothetical protein [Edaphobacter flagellatus]